AAPGGHGESRRAHRREPSGPAEQPEARGVQPRGAHADDLPDLKRDRVLSVRSGKDHRGRPRDRATEPDPAEISAQAHDRVGPPQDLRGQERGIGAIRRGACLRGNIPLLSGITPAIIRCDYGVADPPNTSVATIEYWAPPLVRTLFFRWIRSIRWPPKTSSRRSSRILRTRSRSRCPFTRAKVTWAFHGRRSAANPSDSSEASRAAATRAMGPAPSTPTQITFIQERLGNAPVPRTVMSNGRTSAQASRMVATISETSPSSVSPRNFTVRWSWSVETTLSEALALRNWSAKLSSGGDGGMSTAMNPRNVTGLGLRAPARSSPPRTDPVRRIGRGDGPPERPSARCSSRPRGRRKVPRQGPGHRSSRGPLR